MEKILETLLENENKFEGIAQLLFRDADQDKNRVIDSNEFKQMIFLLADEFGLPMPTEEQIKQTMNKVDLNHNGKIEYDEFKQFLKDLFTNLVNSNKLN